MLYIYIYTYFNDICGFLRFTNVSGKNIDELLVRKNSEKLKFVDFD